jgi:PIN domain-containing protein
LPRDDFVLFLDRSLGRIKVAEALRAREVHVEIHDDHFDSKTPDSEWLRRTGESGWSVVTHDKNIRFRRLEQLAIRDALARVFS